MSNFQIENQFRIVIEFVKDHKSNGKNRLNQLEGSLRSK